MRPWRSAEWHWAVGGALLLIATGLIPAGAAAHAVMDGLDVYLFLAGMLVLAELARAEGLFEQLAALAVRRAAPSQSRLFFLTYAAGVGVTALLSNDGTIVLLTPAILAAVRTARVNALPYAFACALVANAASFILPISNPANLVVFDHLPALAPWVRSFALPSFVAVGVTGLCLYACCARMLSRPYDVQPQKRPMERHAKAAAWTIGICVAGIVVVSAMGRPVGAWTFAAAVACAAAISLANLPAVRGALRSTPWSILPLVAGLFVVVTALDRSGVLELARHFLQFAGELPAVAAREISGTVAAATCNLLNNLPIAVIARYSVHSGRIPVHVVRSVLIGVDLGPNLTPAGSLATILWLIMLRREGIQVTPKQFMKIGLAVTVPALLLSLALEL